MADVKDTLVHALDERDNLMRYLMSDIIKMLLEKNSRLDLQQITIDMCSMSAQELINMHSSISCEFKEKFHESNSKKSL